MLVEINNKVYNMNKVDFNNVLKSVREAKKGSYSIYCLVQMNKALFIDEIFENKIELINKVYDYASKNIKVFYTIKD